MFAFILVVSAIVIGGLPAVIADYRGHNFFLWWLFGATLIVVALPLALSLKATDAALRTEKRYRQYDRDFLECSGCYDSIRLDATSCKYCGREVARGSMSGTVTRRWQEPWQG